MQLVVQDLPGHLEADHECCRHTRSEFARHRRAVPAHTFIGAMRIGCELRGVQPEVRARGYRGPVPDRGLCLRTRICIAQNVIPPRGTAWYPVRSGEGRAGIRSVGMLAHTTGSWFSPISLVNPAPEPGALHRCRRIPGRSYRNRARPAATPSAARESAPTERDRPAPTERDYASAICRAGEHHGVGSVPITG